MSVYACNLISPTKNIVERFSNLDEAFDYIIKELMIEAVMSKDEASEIINRVKIIYIDSGLPSDFNVWEVDNDYGELVKMYINKI